tara:strand:- start:76 stop:549 length:474 start_codon:yes stop_codon:yes gene_type:complete
MALTRVKSSGINLADTFAFTGTVSGAGLSEETGTWTPSVTGMGSPSTAIGRYTKLGKTVTVQGVLVGATSGSGSMVVSGLPYAANSTSDYYQSGTVGWISHVGFTSGSMLGVTIRVNPNTTTMTFMRYRHANNGDGLQASQQSGTQTFYFGATYITD